MWLYIAVAILLLLFFLVSLLFFRRAFRRPETKDLTEEEAFITSELFGYASVLAPALEWFRKQPWEELSLAAGDGTALKGLWLPKSGSKVCLLLFHGYGGLPQDLCLSARWAARRGWSVLIPYQRAHGKSGGSYCSLGLLEAEDCVLWAGKAAALAEGSRLILHGMGMGAFTVLNALGKGMPSQVAAAISEGTYDSPKNMMKTVMREQMRMRTFPLLQLFCLYGRLVWKRSAGAADLRLSLKEETAVPVLFIHGKKDLRVPFKMTEEAYKACAARKELYLSENAGHAACAPADISAFFQKWQDFLQPLTADGTGKPKTRK